MNKPLPNLADQRKQLKNYFLQLAPETELTELNELVSAFEMDSFSKNQFILKSNEFSDDFYFICSGLVRIYYNKEGKDITNWFMKENMLLVPAYAILTGHVNIMNFKALENTYVLKIKYSVLESYYYRYHSLANLGRKIVEYYYGAFMIRTFNSLFISAEDRYLFFLREHSDLLKRVPLQYIAAYLGISKETLSRLRAKQLDSINI